MHIVSAVKLVVSDRLIITRSKIAVSGGFQIIMRKEFMFCNFINLAWSWRKEMLSSLFKLMPVPFHFEIKDTTAAITMSIIIITFHKAAGADKYHLVIVSTFRKTTYL